MADIATSLCGCIEHTLQGTLDSLTGFANRFVNEEVRRTQEIIRHAIAGRLPSDILDSIDSDLEGLEARAFNLAAEGFQTPAGLGISKGAECLGVDLLGFVDDILDSASLGSILDPLIDTISNIESSILGPLLNFNVNFDAHISLCGGDPFGSFHLGFTAALENMHVNPLTGLVDLSSMLTHNAISPSLMNVTRKAANIKKLAQNVLDLPSMGGLNQFGLVGTAV